jgi:hypothetical protein
MGVVLAATSYTVGGAMQPLTAGRWSAEGYLAAMKRLFKKFRETWLGRAAALVLIWLISVLIRAWRLTLRVEVVDRSGVLQQRQANGMLGGFWHNRILFVSLMFPHHLRNNTAAITSASRDGEYADILVRQFIGDTVRGSSSRGGSKAMRKLKRLIENGWNVCIALDGPRGPRYSVAPGIALLAKRCRAPFAPISINAPKRWQTKTWDQMQLPKPFSRVQFVIGEPITIDPDCDVRTEGCEQIRNALLAITDDAREK